MKKQSQDDVTNLPRLYKRTNTGAIQQWEIWGGPNVLNDGNGLIITRYGQTDGKIQEASEVITEGKNVGKKNATTPVQQAIAEAQAKWEKQKKKGYVEDLAQAEAGKVDTSVIAGGIAPMLAQKYAEQGDKLEFPCFTQPKLDGVRCIAVIENGKATLWSRTRKPYTSVPHIVAALEREFGHAEQRIVLDGELYNHGYKDNFEELISYLRHEEPQPGYDVFEYHIYDYPSHGGIYKHRLDALSTALRYGVGINPLVLVETAEVEDEEDLMEYFQHWRAHGYEGSMARQAQGKYEEGKRSTGLLKIKEFIDAEFPIVDVKEGRGKMAGKAVFVCSLEGGGTVDAVLKADMATRKRYFEDHSSWKGKKLTIRYQGLTKKGSLRFPVGIAVRDYE